MVSNLRFSRHFLLTLSFILYLIPLWSRGYKIQIQIKGVADTSVILAHYSNKSIYPDDTVRVDSKGKGAFLNKKNLPQGMYVLYLPDGKYFDLMMGEDQTFDLYTDTADFIKNTRIEGSVDNTIFFDFQNYMIQKRDILQKYQNVLRSSSDEMEQKNARRGIDSMVNEGKQRVSQIVTENPDLFVSTFLKSTLEVEVPNTPVRQDGTIDSTWQYRYFKSHYFDNFNPADARLLRTPLYEDKIMYYLEKVILQVPDTINAEVDKLIEESRGDSTLFRYLLITLFNHYGNSNIMGMDAVQVHLAEKYYLQSTWWNDEKFLDDLRDRVKILKPLILGSTAPDVELLVVPTDHFIAAEKDTSLKKFPHVGTLTKISEIKSDYLVLFFWEATCSHCKKAVPEMYKIYKEKLEPKGIKVLAVSTLFGEEGKIKWVDFVNANKTYDWINAWNPYDYQFKIIYDVRTTPQIFILDKDKKIIGKRLGTEQVADLIELYDKQFHR
jgi:thiol-disulfide isomerase/thioredoxin